MSVIMTSRHVQPTNSVIGLGVVGFGLTFALNAAPLLITELAYPTQVRPLYLLGYCAQPVIDFFTTAARQVNFHVQCIVVYRKYCL